MVMCRGENWWASLPSPSGSGTGYGRPVLIIQSDHFTASKIRTIIVAVITSNVELVRAPENVLLPPRLSGLRRKSVVNVSQLITADKSFLTDKVRLLPQKVLGKVESGLRLVLAL